MLNLLLGWSVRNIPEKDPKAKMGNASNADGTTDHEGSVTQFASHILAMQGKAF